MLEKIEKAIKVAKDRLPALTATADLQKCGQSVLHLAIAKAVYSGMANPTDELDEEISFVLGKVRPNLAATDLQQVTQSALHFMQAKAHIEELKPTGKTQPKKQGVGA